MDRETEKITSTSNSQVKRLISLKNKASFRKKEGVFIVEGIKMYKEIPEDRIEAIYIEEKFLELYKNVIKEKYIIVSENVFKQISDTVTPQGILIVVRQQAYKLDEILKKSKKQLFIILDNLQDPGNLGTIIRTAEGAGVSGVIAGKSTVDLYNPKVIRSTMGSVFRVPFIMAENLEEAIDYLKENGVSVYAAHLHGKSYYDNENYNESTAFIIGNESNGVTDKIAAKADKLIRIPMCGKLESLNAAVAAAILMYEAKKKMD
ncbi:MAG: 23S rRNA (guanosine(2251)-2'-O)-methyltransferase RlmB [Lachnospiraceae bacterium]